MPLNACNIDDTQNSGKGLQAVVVDAGGGQTSDDAFRASSLATALGIPPTPV
jgi:hypothetical protein